ncbi:adhesin [Lachnoclostridium sp. An14]|uniref:transporter substrate-binding domain-containing protein n=1 Tax=Lachnoclostridium sp. An14 TaxID=1965562 RepID=UPI000B395235|nr:transporter substrate-binding domain-containing protein [Lachnoclostridium sp. An14]OUQ21304.1 adhesin [Lachnoclostridium sp. An14]
MKNWMRMMAAGVLTAAMVMGLTACGGGSKSGVDAIKDRGVVKVGVKADVPKFSLQNTATGEYEGFEDDLAYALAGKILGISADEAKAQKKVEFQAVNAKTRGPLVENGEVDFVIATFTITPERKETYNFSPAYYTDAVGLLVNNDSGIDDIEDLDGKIIGVSQSSTSKDEFLKYKEANGIAAEPTFQEFATYPELAQALAANQIDAFSVDRAILEGYKNDTNKFLDVRYGEQEYGVCSNKENTELAELINTTVQEMLDNGEMDALMEQNGLTVE